MLALALTGFGTCTTATGATTATASPSAGSPGTHPASTGDTVTLAAASRSIPVPWARLSMFTSLDADSPTLSTPASESGGGLHDTVRSRHRGGRTPRWVWPLSPRPRIQRHFEPPPEPWLPGHRGIDVDARPGQEVSAVAEGIVHFSGWVVDRPVVSIEHAGGLLSTYEPVASELRSGTRVHRGQSIGVVASGSSCEGACLRLGARRDERYLNPLRLLSVTDVILKPPGAIAMRVNYH